MIIDGNYVFLDFEKIKPMAANAFCKFYGEEFREEIKTKFDNTIYIGFHDYKDVVDYYNEYLENFRDEIEYEFFKVLNIPYDDKISEMIFPKENYIVSNSINFATEGGEEIDDRYSEGAKKEILEYREVLKKIFSLDEENLYENILKLKESLNKAINNVELKHDCDVFRDTRSIINTKRIVFKKFLDELRDMGVNISLKDDMIVDSEYFDDNSIYDLECYGIYFDNEFLDSGVIKSFTEDYDKEGRFENRFKHLYNKLNFLEYSKVKFNNFESLDDVKEDYDGLRLLEKEYEYQKNNFVELTTFECVDKNRWKKDWKKGNFIPKHIAESIEYVRNECQDELFLKCKHFDRYKRNKFAIGVDYFTTYNFNIYDHMKPYYRIYINEGLADSDYTLSTLIHELNHVLGFYPTAMGSNMIECKDGLSILSFEYLSRLEEEKERWDWDYVEDEYLEIFQENINQRLTKEVYEIFLKMYENPYVNSKNKELSHSEYEDYDFITEDFYKANKKLLMKNVMEKSLTNLYYDSDGFYEKLGPLGSLRRFIRDNYYKKQDENRTKYSVSDLRKIGALIGYFEKEVLYFISVKDVSQEQIENGEYKNILSAEESERLEYVLKERDRLNKLLVEGKKKLGKEESILEK